MENLTPNVLLIQGAPNTNKDATALAVWYTIAEYLQKALVPFLVCDHLSWTDNLLPDRRNLVVFQSIHSISAYEQILSSFRLECAVVISPTQPADGQKPEWESLLRSSKLPVNRIITDSDGSRKIIDRVLQEERRDIEIIHPNFNLLAGFTDQLTYTSLSEIDDRISLADGILPQRGWSIAWEKTNFPEVFDGIPATPGRWTFFDSPDYDSSATKDNVEHIDYSRLEQALEYYRLSDENRAANIRVINRLCSPFIRDFTDKKIGILGTKLTFIDELARAIGHSTGATVELDPWKYLSAPPDPRKSEQLLNESDVVIAEWARPNNFWIQDRVPSSKNLIVRAHRYEITTHFPRLINLDKYTAGVVIVPWVGRKLVQEFNWPSEKMVYIPNFVNQQYFSRPKHRDARFTLGMVGITPSLKRLDLALDLLTSLREKDARYILRVRGHLPNTHVNWQSDPRLARQWGEIVARVNYDPRLRGAVHFDPPGRDMAAWYQQIGVILSVSDIEGSHVALAEGISSGALPVARRWPGIETLWPEDFIFDSLGSATDWVWQSSDPEVFEELTAKFRRHQSLQDQDVLKAWGYLIDGDVSAAQSVFGEVDWFAPIFSSTKQRDLYA